VVLIVLVFGRAGTYGVFHTLVKLKNSCQSGLILKLSDAKKKCQCIERDMFPFPILLCCKLPIINKIPIPFLSDYLSNKTKPMGNMYLMTHITTILSSCVCVILMLYMINKAASRFPPRPPPPIFIPIIFWMCSQSCSSASILAGDVVKRR